MRTQGSTSQMLTGGQHGNPQHAGAPARSPQPKHARSWRRNLTLTVLSLPVAVTMLMMIVSQVWIATLPNQYTATSAIAFSPKVTQNGSIPGSETLNLQAAKYVVFLDADPVVQAAATDSGMTVAELSKGSTSSAIVPGTATLAISVTSEDANEASAAANAYAAQIMERAKSDPVLTAEQIAAAVPPSSPSGPARTVLTVLAAAASILVGMALLLAGLAGLRHIRTTPAGRRVPAWLRDPDDGQPNGSGTSASGHGQAR